MIGIIYVGNINRAPYLKNYTDELDKFNKEYEIIFWDRAKEKSQKYLDTGAKEYHIFNLESIEMQSPVFKVRDFMKFSRYAREKIEAANYEQLILLTSMSAMVLYPLIKKKYVNKYIFDYRDASYEFFPVFSHYLKKIINNSYFTAVSSRGFLEILPKESNKYLIVHNNNYKEISFTDLNLSSPINITYIGGLRETPYMKEIINIFANDSRFILSIHGGGENFNELKDFSSQFNNIKLYGQYNESEKNEILTDADFILYNYPNSFVNNYATANKMYDGIFKGIPLIANTGTFSGEFIEKNNIGLSLELDDEDYKEKILAFYQQFNQDTFRNRCIELADQVLEDSRKYTKQIQKFISK